MDMDSDSDSDDEQLLPFELSEDFLTGFNYEDIQSTSPISKAVSKADIAGLKLLIQNGKNVNIPDNNGNVPLHIAAVQCTEPHSVELLNILLQHPDINLNSKNHLGDTPLLSILQTQQPHALIMALLEAGCDINIHNNMGELPLHFAVKRSSPTIALELIVRGADINAQDENGYTPLHHAVEKNNLETVSMLLCNSADVSIRSMSNLTPFMYAVNDINKLEVAQALFDYYDDFSCRADDGYTALLLAANSLNPITIDIVKAGADVNCVPQFGTNLLLFALYFPTAELFKLIWPNFDKNILLQGGGSLISAFIKDCSYPVSDWLHCLYLLLNLDIRFDLIQENYEMFPNPCRAGFMSSMIYSSFARSVELSDRLAIIYQCLSVGVKVYINDINLVHELYGLNEELEVFIQLGSHINILNEDAHNNFPLPTFIFNQVDNYSLEHIVKLFNNQIAYYARTGRRTETRTDIVYALGFFSLPYTVKQEIIESVLCWPDVKSAIIAKFKSIPELPSLTELCRNRIRNCIQHNHNIKNPCQFHKTVQSLDFPSILKDVIRFKSPVY